MSPGSSQAGTLTCKEDTCSFLLSLTSLESHSLSCVDMYVALSKTKAPSDPWCPGGCGAARALTAGGSGNTTASLENCLKGSAEADRVVTAQPEMPLQPCIQGDTSVCHLKTHTFRFTAVAFVGSDPNAHGGRQGVNCSVFSQQDA